MRELEMSEMEEIGGGGNWEGIGLGSAIGGGVGISAYEGASMASWAAAGAAGAVGAFGGAAIAGAFLAGFAVGTWIYDVSTR